MYPKIDGFNTKAITLYANDNIKPGTPVKLTENAGAAPAALNEKFCGICIDQRGNYVTVVLSGYCETPYSGTAPIIGYNNLAADGNGGALTHKDGRELLVFQVDSENKMISIML